MGFVFISGDLALDFIGTLKWRRSDPEELLAAPEDLPRWAVEAGVVTEKPQVNAAELRRLLVLREAIYRLVIHSMDGRPWPEDDLYTLSTEANGPQPQLTLTPSGIVRVGDAETIASTVARSAVELLAGIGSLQIRECARAECTRIFIDRSRGGNRQWCGMEECGNRIKAANYRSRKNKPTDSTDPSAVVDLMTAARAIGRTEP